jgi:mannose-6-phosphate isomerase
MQALYPLKFTPQYKEKIWGGHHLKPLLNKSIPSDKTGESWEISAVENNVSVIANGFLEGNTLQELLEIYMGDLVGEKLFKKFGIEFPLLIKYIDANDVLSVQVHPDDTLAKKRHNAYGKTEMWYVIDAEPEAQLISGFKKELTKQEYANHLEQGTLEKVLNFEPVKAGDVFYMPSGRVHAIGAGIVLAEIQQTSDVTYRIFDWNRKDEKGQGRELHTELAMDAIDFSVQKEYRTHYENKPNEPAPIVKSSYFSTNKLILDKPLERDFHEIDSFKIYMCLEGAATLICDEHTQEKLSKGETVLIPASFEHIELSPVGQTTLLEVYVEDIQAKDKVL